MPVKRVARIVFQNGTGNLLPRQPFLSPAPYIHEPYGYYGPLEYRWGHYYDRRRRLYAEQLQDYLGVSLCGGGDYRKASNQYQSGLWLTIGGAFLQASSLSSGAMLFRPQPSCRRDEYARQYARQ